MKRSTRIPQQQRDEMARVAIGLAVSLRPEKATRAVAGLFDVSTTTARHLIARGRFLTSPVNLEEKGGAARWRQ